MLIKVYTAFVDRVLHMKTQAVKGAGINFCVLDRSQIMGRDAQQSPDCLCLCPALLISMVLCSSWPAAPRRSAGPDLNEQRWCASHAGWLQEIQINQKGLKKQHNIQNIISLWKLKWLHLAYYMGFTVSVIWCMLGCIWFILRFSFSHFQHIGSNNDHRTEVLGEIFAADVFAYDCVSVDVCCMFVCVSVC